MLDTATKRRIGTARDILVGKVPDPKSQVEQITIALIYKFMDDMDAEAEELGGKRTFFAGEFAKYGWAKLMRSGLGGHETLGLYAEAITRMPENPGVPPLFRDIFKDAYLPYRDPETLRAFLKIIDEFEYDHSERLGDAFEYLLSVLGSQGDAGQFRTPRHIIDFIVDIVDPKKGETILDPACGTSGFLISAWKHIVAANRDENDESTLTPDEQERLAANIRGYDISPDMVRLSLANMYLHGFTDPHIVEYDTLTSDERWNEFADVILANPPFMSPKGGIKPHNRFGIQSNRSEVLFVDYMAEHLTPNGRAGIIVPEGVIFQSGKAYKALRKELIEKYLIAVVSLPAGVFNPYSGVKTSILILDRAAAKASDTIGFFKVTNDGFGLGAQRRELGGSELPAVVAEIVEYRAHSDEEAWIGHYGRAVAKAEIAASGDYNLSGERYRAGASRASPYAIVKLAEVADIFGGATPSKQQPELWDQGDVKWLACRHICDDHHIRGHEKITATGLARIGGQLAPEGALILVSRVSVGKFAVADSDYAINQDLTAIVARDETVILPAYLAALAPHMAEIVERSAEGIGVRGVTRAFVANLQIPLPPLEMQREIVAEIKLYQKVIDGARTILENYRPHIPIDPEWPSIPVAELCKLGRGRVISKQDIVANPGPYPVYSSQTTSDGVLGHLGTYDFEGEYVTWTTDGANAGTVFYRTGRFNCTNVCGTLKLLPTRETRVNMKFFATMLGKLTKPFVVMVGNPKLMNMEVARIPVPLPTLETQREIVAELEAERALVEANRELIGRMEKKIEAAIARVWGAATPEAAEPEKIAAE